MYGQGNEHKFVPHLIVLDTSGPTRQKRGELRWSATNLCTFNAVRKHKKRGCHMAKYQVNGHFAENGLEVPIDRQVRFGRL